MMKNKRSETNEIKDKSPIIPQRNKIRNLLSIHQRQLNEKQLQFLELAMDKTTKIVFVSGPAGTSKAQPMDSDILTDVGWVKMKNITPGSRVIGDDGKSHNVISIHPQGIKDIYKITFSDNSFCECTLDHLWKTQTSKDRNQRKKINGERCWLKQKEGTVKSTKEILNTLYVRKNSLNHSIPITEPVEFYHKTHIISPYVMGILLGDGCFRVKGQVTFTSNDGQIIDRLSQEIPKEMETKKRSKNSKYDYVIKCKSYSNAYKNGNPIKNEIISLKLNNLKSEEKFIPKDYLFDSIKNRIELLRGLMDSDGSVSKNGYSISFTTTSKQLCNDVRFLVESVGGICYENIYKNNYFYLNEKLKGLDSYKLSICMPIEINPFYLKRKYDKVIPKSKYKPIRYITNISLVGEKECQCILIDNISHLYLTNNFIVTHNTYMAVYAALTLLNLRRVSDLIYIRSAVESSEAKLGFLPGEANDKMAPYLAPLTDKLEELLPRGDVDTLKKEERISSIPIGFLRGLNFNAKSIILDEAQNCSYKELVTVVTRMGEFSKMFILADPNQSDINGRGGGFLKMIEIFNDEESKQNGIQTFKFTEEDIVRSGVVRFLCKKLKC